MAEKDRVIKSGQLTLPRLFFLALVGGIVVMTVYAGGIFLTIGYWLLTISICVLLYLIAIDYGVKMERIEVHPTQPAAAISTGAEQPPQSARPQTQESRPKKKSGRPAKRRR